MHRSPEAPPVPTARRRVDLRIGAEAIADFLGTNPRQVYRLAEDGWPIFKIRGKLGARESALLDHLTKLERQAVARGDAA